MECLIGMQFKDFVMIASDKVNAHSIMVMNTDENKLHKISERMVMAVSGEQGDTAQFSEYIAKNIQLYKMRNGYELSPKAAANFTRRNLADALRSSSAYHVSILLGGFDKDAGAELYFIDYLASCVKLPYASHGYGGFFSFSIMDRYHNENMNVEEAYDLMKKCVKEIHQRLIVNLPSFKVQIINKKGIRDMPDITAKALALEQAII